MVLVTGATGFVGRHLVPALVAAGQHVRCLMREGSDRSRLPEGQVECFAGDVASGEGLQDACHGADAVIHLVGIIAERGDATFDRVHVGGTRNVVEAAQASGVGHLIYLSGLGSGPGAESDYHRTKWQAEELCQGSGLGWTVVRSSIVVGHGDGFTPILRGLLRKGPFTPVAGSGQVKMQPIYVGDLVKCLLWCLEHEGAKGQTYEVGGPGQLSFEEMLDVVARLEGVRKPKLHIPMPAMRLIAAVQEEFLSQPDITRDQLRMMQVDNTCEPDVLKRVFGIDPVTYEEAVREALGAEKWTAG